MTLRVWAVPEPDNGGIPDYAREPDAYLAMLALTSDAKACSAARAKNTAFLVLHLQCLAAAQLRYGQTFTPRQVLLAALRLLDDALAEP